GQVHDAAGGVVHEVGAVLAPFLPLRIEHEVIHDQLTPILEELLQRRGTVRPLEHVRRVDFHHRQLAPFSTPGVALPAGFLFPGEQRFAREQPLFPAHDVRSIHLDPPSGWAPSLMGVTRAGFRTLFTISAVAPPVADVAATTSWTIAAAQAGHMIPSPSG